METRICEHFENLVRQLGDNVNLDRANTSKRNSPPNNTALLAAPYEANLECAGSVAAWSSKLEAESGISI